MVCFRVNCLSQDECVSFSCCFYLNLHETLSNVQASNLKDAARRLGGRDKGIAICTEWFIFIQITERAVQ